MKRILAYSCLSVLGLFPAGSSKAQTFFDLNTIQKIEITFNQSNWDYQMDTAKAGAEGYLMAYSVKINGTNFDSAGVKYKGNSSYDSTKIKNPLHINLKKFKSGQNYQGFTDIKLANCYQDPSMIREVLSYAILKNYMDCPRSNFAQVYINGSYVGLYSNDEDINKVYVTSRFSSYSANWNSFFKCSHDTPSPTTKDNLKYISADSNQYMSLYELESNVGWKDLVKLCDTVTNYSSSIASFMDMDRVIWMLAFNNVLVNMDSYSGLFVQNYYLYKDNTNHFNPIMWDLNMSLGGFPFAGSQGGGTGSMSVANMQQMSPTLHGTDADWPLITIVMGNPMYKRMYIAHMRTILNEMFASGTYQTMATQMKAITDTAVQSDTHKFFTYAQFQNAMTTDVAAGSFMIPGITNLMSARTTYLQSTTDFTATPPTIAGVYQSSVISSNINITANVTNATTVYVGYRLDSTLKFTRVQMYDDGAHNDGAAGDNVYGASVGTTSYVGQYYVYAENSTAGMFSPQRAEHEFYRLSATAGVAELTSNGNAIKAFPNPATNTLNIQMPGNNKTENLEVRNVLGQTVLQTEMYQETTINTSFWPSGIYYVLCNGAKEKVVVLH